MSHSQNRPTSQNAYYNNKYKPTQATNYPNYHQSEWGHETNHLAGSHAFSSTNKPIHHIGLIDESGFELSPAELYGTHETEHNSGSSDSNGYQHNSYNNDDSDVFKPVEGIFDLEPNITLSLLVIRSQMTANLFYSLSHKHRKNYIYLFLSLNLSLNLLKNYQISTNF